MKIVSIIGFGFCGRLSFYHLTKSPNPDLKIIIFRKNSAEFGPAFSHFSPNYLLNVPAKKMSAFSNKSEDFCQFLRENYPAIYQEIGDDGFAPRYIYGEYLKKITSQAFANAKQNQIKFDLIDDEVINISYQSGQAYDLKITPTNHKDYDASEIILATGLTQAKLPFESSNPNYISNLWSDTAKNFHQQKTIARPTTQKICLIGSSLTAVDVLVNLIKNNFNGEIIVIARRGNLPKKHFGINPIKSSPISVGDAKEGIIALCLKIRKFLAENKNYNLSQVIDSMRPITQEIWHNLDYKNKVKFLRILPYWNIFRHRSPQSSIDLINQMIKSRQVKIKKGGFKKISEENGQFVIKTKQEEITANYLVNCLGFEFKSHKYPLLKQMIEDKLLAPDLFLCQSNHPQIHLAGGLNIGRDFECTSVPDLTTSVEDIVKKIIFTKTAHE